MLAHVVRVPREHRVPVLALGAGLVVPDLPLPRDAALAQAPSSGSTMRAQPMPRTMGSGSVTSRTA